MCNWYGLKCDGSEQVNKINLHRNNIVGELPSFAHVLPALVSFRADTNALSSQLPADFLAGCPLLNMLLLQNNALFGDIPELVYEKLTVLDLSGNEFRGRIPRLRLPQLTVLRLNNNNLEGGVDGGGLTSEWALSLPRLLAADIGHNPRLGGGLPANLWSAMPLLQYLTHRHAIFQDPSLTQLRDPSRSSSSPWVKIVSQGPCRSMSPRLIST